MSSDILHPRTPFPLGPLRQTPGCGVWFPGGRWQRAGRIRPGRLSLRHPVRAFKAEDRTGIRPAGRRRLIAHVGDRLGRSHRVSCWHRGLKFPHLPGARCPGSGRTEPGSSPAAGMGAGTDSIPVGLASGKISGTSVSQPHHEPGRADKPTSPYNDMTSAKHQLIRSDSAVRIRSRSSSLRMTCGVKMMSSSLRVSSSFVNWNNRGPITGTSERNGIPRTMFALVD